MNAPSRIAVFGAGAAASCHLKALQGLGLEPAAVVTHRPDRVRFVRQLFPAARICWPASEVWRFRPDLAIIASPTDTHRTLSGEAAARRIDVVVEKPLAPTLPEAVAEVEAAEAAGIGFAVCLQHRTKPAGVALRELVASGTLGDLAGGALTVPWWRPQAYYDQPGRGSYARDGGGVLMTQAIHTLDLFLAVAGPPRRVLAAAGRSPLHQLEAEDTLTGVLDYGDGVLVPLRATVAEFPGDVEELVLCGTRGTARLRGGTLTLHRMDSPNGAKGEILVDEPAGDAATDPSAMPVAWHAALLHDAVTAFAEGRPPLASGRAALATQRVVAALYHSAASGSWADLSDRRPATPR